MFLLLAGGLLIILLAVVIAVVSSVVSAVAAATEDEEDWHPDFGLSVFFFVLPVISCIYLSFIAFSFGYSAVIWFGQAVLLLPFRKCLIIDSPLIL